MVLPELPKLLYSAVVFCLLHSFVLDEEVTGVSYLPQNVTNYCYPVFQMNSHSILVMFVVLFVKCLELLTNARTPYALYT